MTVVELSQIELENPPPFKSAARYLTSCFTRYLKCAYHHAKQPQCTVCVTQRWNRPANMIQMSVVYDHVLTFRAAGDGGGRSLRRQGCRASDRWQSSDRISNLRLKMWEDDTTGYLWRDLWAVSSRVCDDRTRCFLKTLRSVGPFLVLGHQKQGLFKRPRASPAVFLETWKQVFFVPKPKPEHKQSIVMREKLEIGPTEKHKAATIKTVTLETS